MSKVEYDLYFESVEQRNVEYNARGSVSDFDACVREYAELSCAAKAACVGIYDLKYGLAAAERLDLFPTSTTHQPAPLFIFIHGGYWRSQTKEDAALMAKVFTDAGIAVATVEYTLLPHATLAEVVREIRSAVAWLYHNVEKFGVNPSKFYVGGSSAGGHLVGMLLASQWHDEFNVPPDLIKGAVALSGVFDIEPLCDIGPNEWLRLEPYQAKTLSPIHLIPETAPPLILSVGGLETEGFKRQTQAFEAAWRDKGHAVLTISAPDRNHFNLLSELSRSERPLTQAIIKLIQETSCN
ncbi:alpha/beta hydrolase fold protein [compost metagenome]